METSRPPRIRNIAELADIAGVSPATVSRALSGSLLVKERTRTHIQAIAKAHGFRPNVLARRLRTQKTGAIGVVIPLGYDQKQHVSDPFFLTMLGHLADGLTERGYDVMLSRVIPDADDWLDRIVDSGMLDGVLLLGQSDQIDVIERVARRYLPMVVWGGQATGQVHCSVGTDNVLGGQLATEHVLGRGAKRLVFMGDLRSREIVSRLEGTRSIVANYDRAELTVMDVPLAHDGLDAAIAEHLAQLDTPPDAIFAATDAMAFGVLRALADRGVAVPGTTRVIGYDDLPIATQTVPRLTTIHQDIAQGARSMIAALFERMAGEDSKSVVMPPSLIVRQSA